MASWFQDSRAASVIRTDGALVCCRCQVARTRFERAFGLLGRARLEPGDGMLFPRTRAVHTHFMRFPIDVVFLDADNRVVRVVSRLRPWRAASSRQARAVLEIAAGAAAHVGLQPGDHVSVRAPEPA